ncbi:protein-tyrosine phosphatase-like protein [Lasiosphaeria hispida]|uniref:Protein-tyrosine phosphatase-like protein n=1 Tax=Lasiosphaeria hispida TaxID=260671 RepID=A0AAJ0HBY8_9PEZI|nr:protein-tyrosine phosphatase-like protein [Lasiosphaeria hispida]
MDRFPRFGRKKDVPAPTIITPGTGVDISGKTTPPPGDLQPVVPVRPAQKLSPFRVFRRSVGKRARDSPPASLPHSPAAAAVIAPDGIADRPVSPLSLKTPPKIPAFLDLSVQEIENKFADLVWLERDRVSQSVVNPSPDFRWARVSGPYLKTLDRYMNIQPWHNNRIKLRVPQGKIDYINASPIVLTPSPRPANDSRPGQPREPDRYIAMQGPKASSIDHVWRMVVEQLESPSVIVMLTETHEGPMEKCAPYFPRSKEDPPIEINKRDEFGDGFRVTVRCEGLEETPAGAAIELRKMVIQVHSRARSQMAESDGSITNGRNSSASTHTTEKFHHDFDVEMKSPGGIASGPTSQPAVSNGSSSTTSLAEEEGDPIILEERIVWHFLYKKWPDFGVPALADLESFFTLMRLSREKNASPNNPRIVHCSAGVGRSGTFIALEHLIRELDAGVLEHYDERMVTPGRGSLESPGSGRGGSVATSPTSTSIVEEEGEDLIYSTVNQLREQRRTMVQAESQYLFIYQVLRKLWQDKYGHGSEAAGEPAAKRLEVDPFMEGA